MTTRTLGHTLALFLLGFFLTAEASAQVATFDNVDINDQLNVLGDSEIQGKLIVDGGGDLQGEEIRIEASDTLGLGANNVVGIGAEAVVLLGDYYASITGEFVDIYGLQQVLIDSTNIFLYGNFRVQNHSFLRENVCIGTTAPSGNELLYIGGNTSPGDAEPRIVVENQTTTPAFREMFSLVNNGGSLFSFTDTNLDSQWFFSSNSVGAFNISLSGTGGSELAIEQSGRVVLGPGGARNFDLRPNGNLHILGTLFQSSDRNLKEGFQDVEPESVLGKIDKLPVTTWKFKANKANRHMGPTAQDFYAAFGLGQDEKTIAPVDGVGVSLAGIKALSTQVKQKDTEIKELSQELKSQKELIQLLSKRLSALESKSDAKSQAKPVGLISSAVFAK